MVESNRESFKKMFPNLSRELGSGENKVTIDSVRANPEDVENAPIDKFHNYNPTVMDFLRRCATQNEAIEIIDYLEKRCEITKEHAKELRKQLENRGVRSFGPKKEDGYYFKQSGLC